MWEQNCINRFSAVYNTVKNIYRHQRSLFSSPPKNFLKNNNLCYAVTNQLLDWKCKQQIAFVFCHTKWNAQEPILLKNNHWIMIYGLDPLWFSATHICYSYWKIKYFILFSWDILYKTKIFFMILGIFNFDKENNMFSIFLTTN